MILPKLTEENPLASVAIIRLAWEQYCHQIFSGGKSAYGALLQNIVPEFSEGGITINLASETQKNQLANFENQFKKFISEKHHTTVNIIIQLSKTIENTTKKLYQPTDIFKEMIKENPLLTKLKIELSLDFDYNS